MFKENIKRIDIYYVLFLLFLIIIAILTWGVAEAIRSIGSQCLEDPINFGIRSLEDFNNATVTCTLANPGANQLVFDGIKTKPLIPEGASDYDAYDFKENYTG